MNPIRSLLRSVSTRQSQAANVPTGQANRQSNADRFSLLLCLLVSLALAFAFTFYFLPLLHQVVSR